MQHTSFLLIEDPNRCSLLGEDWNNKPYWSCYPLRSFLLILSYSSLFTKEGNAGRATLQINYGFPAGVYLRITRSPRILAKERSILLASMYFPINSLIRSGWLAFWGLRISASKLFK